MPAHQVDDLDADAGWDRAQRGETEVERLDRNWSDLLQELRVTQTGVQLLTGFLLTLPFQQRFDQLDRAPRVAYTLTVVAAALATVSLVAPVSLHRLLFRQHARPVMVALAHRFAVVGLMLLGIALSGTVEVIFSMVEGDVTGAVAGFVIFVIFVGVWLCLPIALRTGESTSGKS